MLQLSNVQCSFKMWAFGDRQELYVMVGSSPSMSSTASMPLNKQNLLCNDLVNFSSDVIRLENATSAFTFTVSALMELAASCNTNTVHDKLGAVLLVRNAQNQKSKNKNQKKKNEKQFERCLHERLQCANQMSV